VTVFVVFEAVIVKINVQMLLLVVCVMVDKERNARYKKLVGRYA
jgi:hypothetical protein